MNITHQLVEILRVGNFLKLVRNQSGVSHLDMVYPFGRDWRLGYAFLSVTDTVQSNGLTYHRMSGRREFFNGPSFNVN